MLDLPLKTFWMLQKNVDRIAAEEAIHLATVMIQTQSGEGFQELMTEMRKRMGKVALIDEGKKAQTEQLDRAGLHALKELGKLS